MVAAVTSQSTTLCLGLEAVTVDGVLRTTPFLLFDGNCSEAMTFYHSCFGGELTVTRLSDSPMKDQLPPEKHGRVINAHLRSAAVEISATDWMSAPTYVPRQGNTTAILLMADTYVELRTLFGRLADGAEKERFQDLHDLPIGTYGQLTDQFGVSWIFLSNEHQMKGESRGRE